jgi:hypothetical protein
MWAVTQNDISIKLKRLFDILGQPAWCCSQYVHQYMHRVNNIQYGVNIVFTTPATCPAIIRIILRQDAS